MNHKNYLKISMSYNKYLLCDFIDPSSKEKLFVEIDAANVIGHSTFAVYLGTLKDSKNKYLQDVAIKQIFVKKDEIINEVEIMKKVHHENVVNLFHSNKTESKTEIVKLSLIMEYCEGLDLSKFLEKNPKLPEWQIREYFRQIVTGLTYLHSENIIHRDIKPQNILLANKNKTIKIGDYGISRIIKLDMSSATMFKGTYGFMAPEVIDKQITDQGTYDFSADIFSLGVTLYYMHFQKQPWIRSGTLNASKKLLCGDLISLYQKVLNKGMDIFPNDVEISIAAKRLILKMLEMNPIQRIKMVDILRDPYLQEEIPMVKNPKTTEIFMRLDFEANKIVLAQDLLTNIHENEEHCENKLVWVKSLLFLCKYIEFSTICLDSALKQKGSNQWFPKEKWALFYEDDIYGKIVKKVKMMVCNSRKNLEKLISKINAHSEIILNESSFLDDFNVSLINLLLEYKKSLYDKDNLNNDKLVIVIYELMTILNFTNSSISNDDINMKFENFLNNLNENLEKKKWVILQRFEAFFTKMKN